MTLAEATAKSASAELFEPDGHRLLRTVRRRGGSTETTALELSPKADSAWTLDAQHDFSWLSSRVAPTASSSETVRVADLFAGCGGLTLGVQEACRALNLSMTSVLAADIDTDALAVYGANFPTAMLISTPLDEVFLRMGSATSAREEAFVEPLRGLDLLIGGPPCQGHSDLNNHTRGTDPQNELYGVMARVCELVRPTHVIIENVPGVARDSSRIAQRTWAYLAQLGYELHSGVLDANRVGVAQNRKRSITLCSLKEAPNVVAAEQDAHVRSRSLSWAIADLTVDNRTAPFDTPPAPNEASRRRIDYLFDHGLYELPNSERPDCHRLKPHSYVSMYGRLYPDKPSQTITTGFGSMGRGRFVHPHERRTITPHEAARIQGFPDYFRFETTSRSLLHKLIGNAVPPRLGYAAALQLLR